MAKKQAKQSKKANGKKFAPAKLPAGFTAVNVQGTFGKWHNWEKQSVLIGKVVQLGKYDGEFGVQRTMTVQQGKELSTFSESKALEGLFADKKIIGKQVYIQFLGSTEFGKANRNGERRTVKQFSVGVK